MEKERISLGVKHLNNDPVKQFVDKHPIKSIVSGEVSSIDEKGLTVILDKNISGFIKINFWRGSYIYSNSNY